MLSPNNKTRFLRLLDWLLRISGTLSLINLAADLRSWLNLGDKFLSLIGSISINLSNFIGNFVHFIVEFWESVLSYLLWFIPPELQAPSAVLAVLVLYIIQAWFKKTDKDLNQWYLYQSWVLRAALILGAVDGIYISTVHIFIILYLFIYMINHSVSQIRTGSINKSGKRRHVFYIMVNTIFLIALYVSIFTTLFPFLRKLVSLIQTQYYSALLFNLYALFMAAIGYLGLVMFWIMKLILGTEKFNQMKGDYVKDKSSTQP